MKTITTFLLLFFYTALSHSQILKKTEGIFNSKGEFKLTLKKPLEKDKAYNLSFCLKNLSQNKEGTVEAIYKDKLGQCDNFFYRKKREHIITEFNLSTKAIDPKIHCFHHIFAGSNQQEIILRVTGESNQKIEIENIKIIEYENEKDFLVNQDFNIRHREVSIRGLHNNLCGLFSINKIYHKGELLNFDFGSADLVDNEFLRTKDYILNPDSTKSIGINCGLISNFKDGKEYVAIQLNKKLLKGHKYKFSMIYRHYEGSKHASNNLSVSFINPKDTSKTNRTFFVSDEIITNTDWETFEFNYVANGDEVFVLIGSGYREDEKKEIVRYNKNKGVVYYLISSPIIEEKFNQ